MGNRRMAKKSATVLNFTMRNIYTKTTLRSIKLRFLFVAAEKYPVCLVHTGQTGYFSFRVYLDSAAGAA